MLYILIHNQLNVRQTTIRESSLKKGAFLFWYILYIFDYYLFNRKDMNLENEEYKKKHLEFEIVGNKQLRKDLDDQLQVLKLKSPSRERSLAITKLEECIMWLGMDLKRLGAANPYPSSKDPSTGAIVEPTADGLKF